MTWTDPRGVPEHVRELSNELQSTADYVRGAYEDGENVGAVQYSVDNVERVPTRIREHLETL
jgi:hypothetical protein